MVSYIKGGTQAKGIWKKKSGISLALMPPTSALPIGIKLTN